MNMPSVIKRCPFCGGHANLYYDDPYDGYQGPNTGHYVVHCRDCSAQVIAQSEAAAIDKWNCRSEAGTPVPCSRCEYRTYSEPMPRRHWRCGNRLSPCKDRIVNDEFYCPYGKEEEF